MHTLGPWKVNKGLGAPEIVSNNRRIAKVWYEGGSEDREVHANAKLIAKAPELKDALQAFVEYFEADYDQPEEYHRAVKLLEREILT